MHLVVDNQTLKDHLDTIASALGGNDAEPISGHFLFRVGPDYVDVLAGGNAVGLCGYRRISGIAPTNVEDGTEVSFTASGARLLGFLAACGDGNLNVTYDDSTSQVSVVPESSRTNFTLDSLPPNNSFNFEADFEVAEAKGVTGLVDKEDVETAFSFTSPFIGANLANPGFSLCRMEPSDEGSLIKSGDGKSVAIYRRSDFTGDFKLKGDKLSNVSSFIKKCTGKLSLFTGQNNYFIVSEDGSYYGFKMVSFDFPQMKGLDLFSETGDHVIRINRASLKGALSRLKWSLDNDQVRMSFKVVDGDPDDVLNSVLHIAAKANNGRISTEQVGVHRPSGSGDAEFFLNYKNVLQGIDKFVSDDVSLYLTFGKFPFSKILEKEDDNGVSVTRVLFLALMRKPR